MKGPEEADAHPGFHVKDKLENRLHDMVCDGKIKLRAQQQIAANWQTLYKKYSAPRRPAEGSTAA